jgi:hypothetical protein
MNPKLKDYLVPIGKLTIAAAFLEEVVIRWGALLSEGDHLDTHSKSLLRGLDKNLDFLADRVKIRISPTSQRRVLDLIETGRTLKNRRNENVHGVWVEMVDVDTGAFSKVARSRYEKDATGKLIWDHHTPTIPELEQLAADLNKNARELNECVADLWDTDEKVQRWRAKHGF